METLKLHPAWIGLVAAAKSGEVTTLTDDSREAIVQAHRVISQMQADKILRQDRTRHLSTTEASEWLRDNRRIELKPDTIKRLCLINKLPAKKAGRDWLIPVATLRRHDFGAGRGRPKKKPE